MSSSTAEVDAGVGTGSSQVEVGGSYSRRRPKGATMLADLDLLLIAVFCTADDLLPEPAKNARRILTDAEVVTLAVAQAIMGITSDARFLKVARKQLAHLFPLLPNRPGYLKRRQRLSDTIEALTGRLRERQPRLPRRPGAGRLDPGRVRPQHRNDPAQPARRRRRLRLLREPQPLLLGLPPARPVRPGRHPTRAHAHLAQDPRTRRLPHPARSAANATGTCS